MAGNLLIGQEWEPRNLCDPVRITAITGCNATLFRISDGALWGLLGKAQLRQVECIVHFDLHAKANISSVALALPSGSTPLPTFHLVVASSLEISGWCDWVAWGISATKITTTSISPDFSPAKDRINAFQAAAECKPHWQTGKPAYQSSYLISTPTRGWWISRLKGEGQLTWAPLLWFPMMKKYARVISYTMSSEDQVAFFAQAWCSMAINSDTSDEESWDGVSTTEGEN